MIDLIAREGSVNALNILLLLALSILLYPILCAIYNVSPLHPLSHYPGPLTWRASRLPWIVAVQSGYLHLHIKSFHDLYGPIVRVAPNELSYTDPQAWKDIYAAPARTSSTVDSPYSGLLERNPIWFRKSKPSDPYSIMGPDEASHARYRRAFMSAFSDKALRDYSYVLEDFAELFIRKLHVAASTSQPVDLMAWFNCLTFDISGVLSFGESFGSTEAGKAHPWVAIACAFGKAIAKMAGLNFLGLTSGPFGVLIKSIIPKEVQDRIAYHRQLTEQKVARYLDSADTNKERAAFIDSALRFNEDPKHSSDIVTQKELALNMSILIFAGSETTSSALSAIFRYLLQNPRCLATLTAEIRTTFPTSSAITVSSVTPLPYLNAIISESMRMAPAVVIGVPRVVPPSGATICSHPVPGGTYVVINQYPLYRSPLVFRNPNTFLPERFLPTKNDTTTNDLFNTPSETDAFQPFSVGRHQCIGQRLAWTELRLVTAKLLWSFDVSFHHAAREKGRDFVMQKTFIFWEKEELLVRLRERT